ncbi:hypothetical protein C7M84_013865 [Penaeus vannamei]|uniref:Uncharacterized protein n=1 Tax=Penaeus vannamei TaxID=6689 RepID=A0A423SUX2_PENVA|nr:hypothetical protein C7M84_013865 [Penaeus vannamei]
MRSTEGDRQRQRSLVTGERVTVLSLIEKYINPSSSLVIPGRSVARPRHPAIPIQSARPCPGRPTLSFPNGLSIQSGYPCLVLSPAIQTICYPAIPAASRPSLSQSAAPVADQPVLPYALSIQSGYPCQFLSPPTSRPPHPVLLLSCSISSLLIPAQFCRPPIPGIPLSAILPIPPIPAIRPSLSSQPAHVQAPNPDYPPISVQSTLRPLSPIPLTFPNLSSQSFSHLSHFTLFSLLFPLISLPLTDFSLSRSFALGFVPLPSSLSHSFAFPFPHAHFTFATLLLHSPWTTRLPVPPLPFHSLLILSSLISSSPLPLLQLFSSPSSPTLPHSLIPFCSPFPLIHPCSRPPSSSPSYSSLPWHPPSPLASFTLALTLFPNLLTPTHPLSLSKFTLALAPPHHSPSPPPPLSLLSLQEALVPSSLGLPAFPPPPPSAGQPRTGGRRRPNDY